MVFPFYCIGAQSRFIILHKIRNVYPPRASDRSRRPLRRLRRRASPPRPHSTARPRVRASARRPRPCVDERTMRRFMRDASRLERDAKAEHAFYHSLISQLQTELEDAKHSSELLRAELDRAREGRSRDIATSSATTPSGDATNARETTTVGVERETRGEDEATRDAKAEETERELIALRAKVAGVERAKAKKVRVMRMMTRNARGWWRSWMRCENTCERRRRARIERTPR